MLRTDTDVHGHVCVYRLHLKYQKTGNLSFCLLIKEFKRETKAVDESHKGANAHPVPLLLCFSRRVTSGGTSNKPRVSPPGRPNRFHKPVHSTPGKLVIPLGHLSKGATWNELIQACLECFGKRPVQKPVKCWGEVLDQVFGVIFCGETFVSGHKHRPVQCACSTESGE